MELTAVYTKHLPGPDALKKVLIYPVNGEWTPVFVSKGPPEERIGVLVQSSSTLRRWSSLDRLVRWLRSNFDPPLIEIARENLS